MVEVATPRSITSMQFQHWLKVLYVFEALHIAGGALTPDGSDVRRDIVHKIPGALSLCVSCRARSVAPASDSSLSMSERTALNVRKRFRNCAVAFLRAALRSSVSLVTIPSVHTDVSFRRAPAKKYCRRHPEK